VRAEFGAAIWKAVELSLPELRRWMAWAPAASLDHIREFAAGAEQEWGKTGFVFSIFESGEVVGGLGLDTFRPLFRSSELGYWIRSDKAGQGLTTEAGAAALEFGFGSVGLHRVELRAAPGNRGSVRVAEKLGFTRLGTLRDGAWSEDGFHDVYVFDLLEHEDRFRL
jgi:ribosomal-protein-serine acetyltransferase